MSVEIKGQKYRTATEVAQELKVHICTLWRWRRKGAIPTGLTSYDCQVLFTADQLVQIREYATKLVPTKMATVRQPGRPKNLIVSS
jgi:hypothetical protein